jgi:hypothetical protein
MKLLRNALIGSAVFWAGKKLVARRRGGLPPRGRSGPRDQPVATGGDGAQTEPPVAGAGGG